MLLAKEVISIVEEAKIFVCLFGAGAGVFQHFSIHTRQIPTYQ